MALSVAQIQQIYERSPNGPLQSPGLGALALSKGFYFGSAISLGYMGNLDYLTYVFNEIACATPESEMGPDTVQPSLGVFNFAPGDQIVAACQARGIPVRGHYLVTGSNTAPGWLTTAVTSAATATSVLTTQINGVMAHYKGQLKWVNVVNEAIGFNGDPNGFQTNVFYTYLGTDPSTGYIATALKLAKAADPNVKVGLNFSGVENSSSPNAEALIQQQVYAYCKKLIAAGTPLDYVGLEMHMGPNQGASWNATLEIAWLAQMSNLGVKLHITEMDRDDLTTGTLTARDAAIATDVNNLVTACLANPAIEVLQVWEISDRDNWRNRGFGAVRSDNLAKRPSLLSWSYGAKAAYTDVRNAISAQRPPTLPTVDKMIQFGTVPTIIAAPAIVSSTTIGTPTYQSTTGGGGGGTFTPNLPTGMLTVLNTGHMTVNPATGGQNGGASGLTWSVTGPTGITTTFTNDSPTTAVASGADQSNGQWSGNVALPSDGGLRFLYQTALNGGYSPCRIGVSNFASTGTGFLYVAFRVRFSTNWNYSLASGNKMFDCRTVNSGNNHILSCNGMGTDGNFHATGSGYPQFLLQGNVTGSIPGGKLGTSNGLPPYNSAPATVYSNPATCSLLASPQLGAWNTWEFYIQPENPTGTGSNNGNLTFWINGVQQWTSVGQTDGTAGQTGINYDSGGWDGFFFDPTFGGDQATDHPPALQSWDIDYWYAAVA